MQSQTTLYLRGLSTSLVREAKVAAARRGSTLTSLVADSLAHALASGGDAYVPAGDELEADMRWYDKHRARLLKRHAGEYIAVVDQAIVDHDPDFAALAARIFSRLGNRSVYMPRVQADEPQARIRSPRRSRR